MLMLGDVLFNNLYNKECVDIYIFIILFRITIGIDF